MATSVDVELADEVARFYADPLGFVKFAFPWSEPGPLQDYKGPDEWQEAFLRELGDQVRARRFDGVSAVPAIRHAVSSGHGIGKSTMAGWLVTWLLSTRPHSIGTVTANTFAQLQSKTWASIQKWLKLSITAHWFRVSGFRIAAIESPDTWFCTAQTCREANSEAFAGQHAASSTSWYLFDEASAIPDRIWEVAEGGLTDGEPHIYCFGNPTRSSGKFHRVCFGSERNRWTHRSIDSRKSALTNKAQIAEWIHDYGEDSDFVRVRVRGLPPAASDLQFIDSTRVYEAQQRAAFALEDEPLVLGVDLARGGGDDCKFRFRCGTDARSIAPIKITGEQSRDSMLVAGKLAEVLSTTWGGRPVHMCFLDETGIGGGIYDRLRQLGFRNVQGVQFGAAAPDEHYANMRSWMWAQLKEWLLRGAIDDDAQLEIDLTGPGFHHNKRDQIVLEAKEEMKKRGLDSPDDGDALALTFAGRVVPRAFRPHAGGGRFFSG